jgi:hypothetical protein
MNNSNMNEKMDRNSSFKIKFKPLKILWEELDFSIKIKLL